MVLFSFSFEQNYESTFHDVCREEFFHHSHPLKDRSRGRGIKMEGDQEGGGSRRRGIKREGDQEGGGSRGRGIKREGDQEGDV